MLSPFTSITPLRLRAFCCCGGSWTLPSNLCSNFAPFPFPESMPCSQGQDLSQSYGRPSANIPPNVKNTSENHFQKYGYGLRIGFALSTGSIFRIFRMPFMFKINTFYVPDAISVLNKHFLFSGCHYCLK